MPSAIASGPEKSPEERFIDLANPHAWLLVADNLHAQAVALNGDRSAVLSRSGPDGTVTGRWHATNRSVFLLGGFALENALKAFLVYEFPALVSGGGISRQLKTHSLTRLRAQSTLAPYPVRCRWVLAEFERGIDSWARYPCATSIQSSEDAQVMLDRLWAAYMFLMRGYGRVLMKLLAKGWHGPLGFYGRFTFSGNFLSTQER